MDLAVSWSVARHVDDVREVIVAESDVDAWRRLRQELVAADVLVDEGGCAVGAQIRLVELPALEDLVLVFDNPSFNRWTLCYCSTTY